MKPHQVHSHMNLALRSTGLHYKGAAAQFGTRRTMRASGLPGTPDSLDLAARQAVELEQRADEQHKYAQQLNKLGRFTGRPAPPHTSTRLGQGQEGFHLHLPPQKLRRRMQKCIGWRTRPLLWSDMSAVWPVSWGTHPAARLLALTMTLAWQRGTAS